MEGAKGSALEWALALLQAPGERHLLRQRPLPDGMEALLGIAAGVMPDALARAAAAFGESQARLREAAQFYVREVLFFPQADAYRVLGVRPEASFEQIKTHHRLLQSWLHPDRPHSEEDAVFAARVNAAWNQLRSPQRRQAYDEQRRRVAESRVLQERPPSVPMPQWQSLPATAAATERWRQRWPMLALLALCVVLAWLALRDLARRPQGWGALPSSTPAVGLADESGDVPFTLAPPHTAARAAQAAVPPVAAARDTARRMVTAMNGSRAKRARQLPEESRAMPESGDRAVQQAMKVAPGGGHGREESGVTPSVSMPDTPVVQAAVADMQEQAGAAVEAVALAQRRTSVPVQTSPGEDVPDFARVQAARQAGELLLQFLQSATRASPPIWNSPQVATRAERLRQQWHAGDGRVRLAPGQWKIGNVHAQLQSGYAITGAEPTSGRLSVRLHWRDGYWLVTDFQVEEISESAP